jgi:hypothetical protein
MRMNGATCQDIADYFGITVSRVQQIVFRLERRWSLTEMLGIDVSQETMRTPSKQQARWLRGIAGTFKANEADSSIAAERPRD